MSFCFQTISSFICCFHLHLSCLATSVTLPSSVCLTQSWCLWALFLVFFTMPQRWFCFGSRSFLTLLLFLKIIFAGVCCWKNSRHPGLAVDQWCRILRWIHFLSLFFHRIFSELNSTEMHLLIVRGINLPAPPGMNLEGCVVFEWVGEGSEECYFCTLKTTWGSELCNQSSTK